MQLRINTEHINWNLQSLRENVDAEIVPVLKAISCDKAVVGSLDSDIVAGTNLEKLESIDRTTMCVRPLTKSEIRSNPDVDIILASDGLSEISEHYDGSVYLMADVDDGREGIPTDEIIKYNNSLKSSIGVSVEGIAANPGCNSGVVDTGKLRSLCDIVNIKFDIDTLSGGSTALLSEKIPSEVDQLRIGEGILTGKHAVEGEAIMDLVNPFTVSATVVKDRGEKVLYNLGTETVNIDSLYDGPEIEKSWSDLSIVHDPDAVFGDREFWKVGYWGVVRAYDSPDVSKVYL